MKGYLTSFAGMFGEAVDERPPVQRIEVPLIQRDYAQGRTSPNVDEIRGNFLDVLHDAASGREPVGLDFVYGTVQDGTLRPLDGQQRLTTLFLLHWYLACRSGQRPAGFPWAQFSYATRDSARRFCQQLVENPLPTGSDAPSTWLVNQPWYRYDWESDPSIQSMLVMIDDINARFRDLDPRAAWDRLTNPADPAISFHLLPIQNMGSEEQLYIKMNSRGKPLTPFENFKARFEATLKELDPDRAKVFAHKIDGDWSDLLWPIHGGDNIVDDEFMRYLEFVAELCEWREGRLEDGAVGRRMRSLFALDNPRANEHLDFLFQAFESWESSSAADAAFRELFATRHDSHAPERIVLFGNDVNVNLFEECCHRFGDLRGKNRVFSYQQSLLLYAVLLHRIHTTQDFPRRLRMLRNLLSSSENEVRRDSMPALTQEVEALVRHGLLSERSAFNRAQIEDEQRKRRLLEEHPHLSATLFALEDEPILRGSLIAFDLNPATLEHRCWPSMRCSPTLRCGRLPREPFSPPVSTSDSGGTRIPSSLAPERRTTKACGESSSPAPGGATWRRPVSSLPACSTRSAQAGLMLPTCFIQRRRRGSTRQPVSRPWTGAFTSSSTSGCARAHRGCTTDAMGSSGTRS